MPTRWLAAGLAVCLLFAVTAAAEKPPVRILPIGDATTDGLTAPDGTPGAYRNDLWQLLTADGYAVNFVGSRMSAQPPLRDPDHEGHPDWTVADIDGHVGGWLRTYAPDVVLLQIGINDLSRGSSPDQTASAVSHLVSTILTVRPQVRLFVGTLLPSPNEKLDAKIVDFNKALNKLRNVHLVDLYSALDTTDVYDNIRPTGGGFSRMAARWYAALLGTQLPRFEAEDANLTGASELRTPTASGGTKAAALAAGASLVVTFSAGQAGDERVYIRADNGTGQACDQQIYGKDGVPVTVRYAGWPAWDVYGITAVTLHVDQGDNTLTFTGGQCGAEIDAIMVAPVTTSPYL
ncbi:GDSL-type esterase/lipase family protein [Fodinicola acaciae]|uniref:GDSL-type esterase/lipase family protein n=1 Tax=Fodinicola acaciae TaxID=2681555 RepID=UPI0013D16808|nr:GDSL-type esterase/lipase family protein [Fodinicola acaciae]